MPIDPTEQTQAGVDIDWMKESERLEAVLKRVLTYTKVAPDATLTPDMMRNRLGTISAIAIHALRTRPDWGG